MARSLGHGSAKSVSPEEFTERLKRIFGDKSRPDVGGERPPAPPRQRRPTLKP